MVFVRDVKRKIISELKVCYELNEIASLSKALFRHILGYSSTQYLLNDDVAILPNELGAFDFAIERLKRFEPIQYVVNSCEFFGLNFYVDSNVLIPRPETEELIGWITETFICSDRILDICTGSGCIAIALKSKYENAKVEAWDISHEALRIAQTNCTTNDLVVDFKEIDVLRYEIDRQVKFDIIVSNPPYVRESERSLMCQNVLDFEPHIALFVSDHDPLLFYKRIAEIAQEQLSVNGKVYFEINEALANEMVVMLESLGFMNVVVKKDMNGKERMVMAQKA